MTTGDKERELLLIIIIIVFGVLGRRFTREQRDAPRDKVPARRCECAQRQVQKKTEGAELKGRECRWTIERLCCKVVKAHNVPVRTLNSIQRDGWVGVP